MSIQAHAFGTEGRDPYKFFASLQLGSADTSFSLDKLTSKGVQEFCKVSHDQFNQCADEANIVVDSGSDSLEFKKTSIWRPSIQFGDRYQYIWNNMAFDVLMGADLSLMSKTYSVRVSENHSDPELAALGPDPAYLGSVKVFSLLPQAMLQIETATTFYGFVGGTLGIGIHRTKEFDLGPAEWNDVALNKFGGMGVNAWEFEEASSNFSLAYGFYIGAGYRLSPQLSMTASYNFFNAGKVPLGKRAQNVTETVVEWKDIEVPFKFNEIRLGLTYRFEPP